MFFRKIGIALSLTTLVGFVYIYTNRPPEAMASQQQPVANLEMPWPQSPKLFDGNVKGFKRQLKWLALNIYYEARSESDKGQQAVAWVTLNRVASKHWPSSIEGVVRQRSQFSWYKNGHGYHPKNSVAWLRAKENAAYVVLNYTTSADLTDGANHYHSIYSHPRWAKSKYKVAKIGRHIFYKLK